VKRLSFTLIELIFVIVILGIMGLISFDIIFRVYDNFATQRNILVLQQQTSRTLKQLEHYFNSAISDSMVMGKDAVPADAEDIFSTDYTEGNLEDNNFTWIHRSKELLRGVWSNPLQENYPVFSGIIDVNASDDDEMQVFDSNLSWFDSMAENLTQQADFNITNGGNVNYRSALYFTSAETAGTTQTRFWNGENSGSLFGIRRVGQVGYDSNLTLSKAPTEIGEKAWITHTALGLRLNDDRNLTLVTNFRPWNPENARISTGTEHTICKNVESLRIWGSTARTMIRIRLCLSMNFDDADTRTYCKEAMVLR
jgi:type II secretory pathway pseudopilin PulG